MRLLPSQLLILATIAGFLLYAFRLRTVLRDRVIFACIVGVGVALALHPDASTSVARALGVGRGADLLLYVLILFTLFQSVYIGARLRTMDARLTRVVREGAVAGAAEPDAGAPNANMPNANAGPPRGAGRGAVTPPAAPPPPSTR